MYLNAHSYYSLRYGTIPVEELVEQAKKSGIEQFALTDINATTGVFDFISACRKHNIHPVIGVDFRVGNRQLFVALARNREGFREMNEVLTFHNQEKLPLPERPSPFEHAYVIYPFGSEPEKLRENEYIGVPISALNKISRGKYAALQSKMVILHTVTFRTNNEWELHRLLRGVSNNCLLTKLNAAEVCGQYEFMMPKDQLLSYYKSFPRLIENTQRILADCHYEIDFAAPKNKQTYTNSRYSDKLLLETLALEGMERRYGKNNKEALRRVRKELEVIEQMEFLSYFLITWDVIRYSNSRDFFHIGRGSGANSIVSYVLGITDICPIELDLYFERFLNPSRTSPPDFDIDWSWKDRDEILGYIFKRFDTEHTAFCGTIGSFKHRSIMRELGKVYGLSKKEIDLLSRSRPTNHDMNSVVQKIHFYGKMLARFPNQRSMHACGVFISEEPLTYYTALDMPPKGFRTTQFDMYIGEDIGFEKLDVLSQRGIGHINDCVKLIEENRGEQLNIRDVDKFKYDEKTNNMLSQGQTLGCFYIESPAMRGLLRRLKCDSYKVLVAASSVIRPGVAKSGMLREYIRRHNFPDEFEYFHPVFEEQLGETYGIMVYQEDVIKIAHHFADLDLADADVLRRAMSGKSRSRKEFERIEKNFFDNCAAKEYPIELSKEVYRQIESFAGYSFCKAHSASYSVESYQSLYLKAHYPIEFIVAVINNFGGFYRTEVYFHEAKMAGANVHNPCVNRSEYLSSVSGRDVFTGFIHLQGLDKKITQLISEERELNGEYLSLDDFVRRIPVGVESLQILIFAGSFRFTGKSKNGLALEARMLLGKNNVRLQEPGLFYEPPKQFKLPELNRSPYEDAFDELELLGFMTSFTPFDLLQTTLRGDMLASEMEKYEGKRVKMVGFLISRKNVPTVAGLMNFGTWVDVAGNYWDSTHFPKALERCPFQGAGCYLISGKVSVDFHFPSVEVDRMEKLPMIPDPRYSDEQYVRPVALPRGGDNNPAMTRRSAYPKKGSVKF